jgi:hypothetical protein
VNQNYFLALKFGDPEEMKTKLEYVRNVKNQATPGAGFASMATGCDVHTVLFA